MKSVLKLTVIGILVIIPLTTVIGQERERQREMMKDGSGPEMLIPDLTEEQKVKIRQLHLDLMKESQPVKNQLGENRARMRSLTTADEPDMKAIEKLIDESSKLQADLQKKMAANHQEVRKLLTEEQRIIFDSRSGQMKARANRRGQGMRELRDQRRMRRHQVEQNQ